ncbi:YkyA family protein [Evansella cellulosilytica]|uniref:Cell-wall binding lipoprotein YkyA, putative n=1 Tax=Evansella cellulosilytica (strain ATCC 21833 / DSM 2522 / FERM P-1141 / JCM 9156 / N-4) TaxID=649639 RepID=E6TUN4_EVAC2|nr:YkyA family protein [Evansella cellulosilytica]ADU30924.1 Cell-wall binding lipoprotein YkyA, putative [Evansella cellulosilytica DSM 2522]
MNKIYTVIIFMLAIFLTGCFNESENPAQFMYEHLEEAVAIEVELGEKQAPLTEAENMEYELYEEMLTLSELSEIEELAQQAIESAESRRELMVEEKEIIDAAYEEFALAKAFIDDIEDEEIKQQADEMVSAMENRYEAYNELYNKYVETIDIDIELYSMVFQEELTVDELQAQHDIVNEAYNEINEFNDMFNQYTTAFNDAKRDFYEAAELDVVFDAN